MQQIQKEPIVPVLAKRNIHERDNLIKFYEKGHKYEILSDLIYISNNLES